MQTVTVEITNSNSLKMLEDLQEKHYIKIIDFSEKSSAALPGDPLSSLEFKNLIESRENDSTVSLKDAKAVWVKQRKQLQKQLK